MQAPKKKASAPAAPSGDAALIAAIEKAGGTVRPIAQNDERREVSFYLQGASVKDADLAPVAKLSKVVHLHLGNTSMHRCGSGGGEGLTDLETLHLEKSKITDAGLAHLKGLTKLTYINLFGTAVTDAGLDHLKGLSALKSLYLFETKVTDAGIAKLKQALPTCNIVKGW